MFSSQVLGGIFVFKFKLDGITRKQATDLEVVKGF